jgi:hypothetical protein
VSKLSLQRYHLQEFIEEIFRYCLRNISSVEASKSDNKNVELGIGKSYEGDAVTSGGAEASNLLRVPAHGMFLNSTAF